MSNPNDWKRGLRMLERGLYVDERTEALHIDPAEFLRGKGYEPNARNLRMLQETWKEMLPKAQIIEVDLP